MGVINLAHGELIMLGAYTTFVVQNICKGLGSPWRESYIFFALIAAFLVGAIAGLILERGVIRYLYGRPLETLLATWGVSLILQQFVRTANSVLAIGIAIFCLLFFGAIWILNRLPNFQQVRKWVITVMLPLSIAIAAVTGGFLSQTYKLAVTKPWFGAQGVAVTAPKWLVGGLNIGTLTLPYVRLFIIALTIACVVGLYAFFQRTSWGLRIRAVTQNRNMSACLGIPTQKVDALTFALGSGLAGVAGVAISLLGSVAPNTGQNYIVNTFMVVVVGGVGKLVGSIVAALAIGTIDYIIASKALLPLVAASKPLTDLVEFFGSTDMAKVMVFALIIVFLQIKPGGLFPEKGRTVDA